MNELAEGARWAFEAVVRATPSILERLANPESCDALAAEADLQRATSVAALIRLAEEDARRRGLQATAEYASALSASAISLIESAYRMIGLYEGLPDAAEVEGCLHGEGTLLYRMLDVADAAMALTHPRGGSA